ncbi:MAG: glycosyltransferase family 4 protein [Candidatus Odinarchaeota archaeon]
MKVNFVLDLESSLKGSGIYSSAKRLADTLVREEGIAVDMNGKGKYDIFHFHTALPPSYLKARNIRKRRKGKSPLIFMHGHSTVEDFVNSFTFTDYLPPVLYPYLTGYYSLADRIISVSEHNRSLLLQYGILPERISVVSNGMDFTKVKRNDNLRIKAREFLGLAEDDLLVFSIGINIYRKAIDVFVKIAEKCPDMTFIWIGKPVVPFVSHVREIKWAYKRARQLSNIRFAGYVTFKTLMGILNGGDVFLYPTREENQGIALLEAVAYGKVPVVREHPVFNWLTNGKDCLKASDVDGFVNQLYWIRNNHEKARELAKAATVHMEEHDLRKVAKEIANLYTEAI